MYNYPNISLIPERKELAKVFLGAFAVQDSIVCERTAEEL